MSARTHLGLEPAATHGKQSPTPAGLAITPRDRRFNREERPDRWWLNGDPVATAWHNALSVAFPRGEAFFIEAIRDHREDAPAKLSAEIRAFIKQEINHTREHVAFNRAARDAGYDLSRIDERIDRLLDIASTRPKIANLAATMALEHFTAIQAHQHLADPEIFNGAPQDITQMWLWHAAEEIEHKGVAYDTWLFATRDWSRWKRWKCKSLMAVIVTRNFVRDRIKDTVELLEQDGLAGWKWKWRIARYLLGRPGVLRRIVPAWIAFFLPGFHPWKLDDRRLIRKYDSEFADAVMPAGEQRPGTPSREAA